MDSRAVRANATEVLRSLPENEAFYFFEDMDKYTGKSASNLAEFCKMTKSVDKNSIRFHFKRHDFERWIKETLRDPLLARRISSIKEPRSEEKLRNQIHRVSKKRLKELNKSLHKKRHQAQTARVQKTKVVKKKGSSKKVEAKGKRSIPQKRKR